MPGGDTTQFLFAPDRQSDGRKYLLVLASGFWAFCLGCTVLSVAFDIFVASMESMLALLGAPVVIAAALLPNLAIAALIPHLQRYQRTHRYALIGALLAGAVIAIPPALVINTILFLPAELSGAPLIELISYATIAGIVEEGIKGALLLFIFFHYRDEFHDPVDGIVIGALIGLGFAMTEDITYFLGGLAGGGVVGFAFTFFLRVVLGWMGHSVFTACFGAALGLARLGPPGGRRLALGIGGYVVAASLHNTFNLLATLLERLANQNPILGLLGIVPLYGLDWLAMIVLGFVVLWGWKREGEIVRTELGPEVAAGVVTPEEYAALPDPGRRRALLEAAQSAGGKGARATLGKLFQLQINLALQKRHTAWGDRPAIPQLHSEEALRGRIAGLRAALAVPPGPPPPAGAALAPRPAPPAFPPPGAPVPPPRWAAGPAGAPAATAPAYPNGAAAGPVSGGALRLVIAGGERGGESVRLQDGLTIGRNAAQATLVLLDARVSRLHARIEYDGGASPPVLVDVGSANGTFVNGERVTRRPLRPGDRITLGGSHLVVTSESPVSE